MELNDYLVVYFSHTGATKNMAEEIAKQLDCEIAEIVPLIPYNSRPDDVAALEALAKQEYEENARDEKSDRCESLQNCIHRISPLVVWHANDPVFIFRKC